MYVCTYVPVRRLRVKLHNKYFKFKKLRRQCPLNLKYFQVQWLHTRLMQDSPATCAKLLPGLVTVTKFYRGHTVG